MSKPPPAAVLPGKQPARHHRAKNVRSSKALARRVHDGRVAFKAGAGGLSELLEDIDPGVLMSKTRAGVPAVVIRDLAERLHRPLAEIGGAIGLSRATLARKISSGATLPLAESDRTMRYVRLWALAVDLWESDAGAAEWLTSPERSLGGETPLHYADTEVGAQRVEHLIGQLEHGIAP